MEISNKQFIDELRIKIIKHCDRDDLEYNDSSLIENENLGIFCQSLSSEGPKHVFGGTKDVSVATIYRT
ncbi:hypothetical protein BpHYR1_038161 [Brachionus plicatilis]|uniref:Uncharacterized protein n=1 Tax=Brachionus plicatilis TaxID=10195 RepID=A0A3M7Q2T6_BRAPC|nr:hypothetical protein BpHYR1_038161 [Brachionus plicatilis]